MGISNQTIAFLDKSIDLSGDAHGLKMAELGAQHMNAEGRFKGSAKAYFESLGVLHTSFDLDQVFGAEFLDLGVPLPEQSDYAGAFDIVTNFGTSEHVVAHYNCFENIHRLCRPAGLMLHTVAPPNHWAHHGRYYYPSEFFEGLARANGYDVIELSSVAHHKHAQRDLMCALFRKAAEDAPFMPEPAFDALPIVCTCQGMIWPAASNVSSRASQAGSTNCKGKQRWPLHPVSKNIPTTRSPRRRAANAMRCVSTAR